MSYDSFSTGLTTFMRTHGLVDRVFPGWEISGFVMHKIPEVTLFMDCRDQSYYRPEVIRDYFAAVGVLPATPTERLAILNKYDVKYLALTENPIDFDCAMFLMSVGDARCVYADGPAFLLERGANRRGAAFTYENDDVAARTDAWNEYWTVGELSERTTAAVRKTVMSAPSPNLYALLLPRRYETRCMNKDLSAYFTAEIARLTRADATGAGSMPRLESALRITEMLIRNGRNCGANEIPRLTVLRGALVSAIHDLQVMRSGCAIRLPFTGASTQ
jgi:hypothetical protein